MQNGENLAKLRIKKRLTCGKLAKYLNVSLSSYKLYELGIIPMSLEEVNILSLYYDVSIDYLLGISDVMEHNNFRKDIDYNYLRFYIRYLRKRARLSQKDIAKEFKYASTSISRFEKSGKNVSIDYLIKMAIKFNISIDFICGKSSRKDIITKNE